VAGRIRGRQNAQQRTFFLNSTGVGAQFTALAHLIYSGCRELGLGHEVPAQWLVESIQP
jgi:ornithine cyclodeaminase/alanine dehydrogenase-like protein (mu-crystallin family)